MDSRAKPALWLIAGPNGVGKTTYALKHIRAVSGSVHFINLDEIARGLSPIAPEVARLAAARVAIGRTREMISRRATFAIETTLAGRAQLGIIEEAAAAGFAVNLLYFIVPAVAVCIARVARRLSEGGHHVPEADIVRRFARSIDNFSRYARAADLWRVFDNSGPNPIAVAEGSCGCCSLLKDDAPIPATLASALAALPACPE